MVLDDLENPDSTGYYYFHENIVYVRSYSYKQYLSELPVKAEPAWLKLKGRKNKRDNFKVN